MYEIYSVRGTLGAMLVMALNLGFLISYLVGAYLPYNIVPCVLVVFPILFLCGSLFLPDTPRFLMLKGRTDDAEKSLRFYKGCMQKTKSSNERFQIEMDKLVAYTNGQQNSENKVTFKDFCKEESHPLVFVAIFNIFFCFQFLHRHTGGSSWYDDWRKYDVSECVQWRFTIAELCEQYIQAVRLRYGSKHIGHYYDLSANGRYLGGNVLD